MYENSTISMDTFRVAVTRPVTVSECDWLKADIPAGTVLNLASDPYRVCSAAGVPVSFPNSPQYFELPADAVVGLIES